MLVHRFRARVFVLGANKRGCSVSDLPEPSSSRRHGLSKCDNVKNKCPNVDKQPAMFFLMKDVLNVKDMGYDNPNMMLGELPPLGRSFGFFGRQARQDAGAWLLELIPHWTGDVASLQLHVALYGSASGSP